MSSIMAAFKRWQSLAKAQVTSSQKERTVGAWLSSTMERCSTLYMPAKEEMTTARGMVPAESSRCRMRRTRDSQLHSTFGGSGAAEDASS